MKSTQIAVLLGILFSAALVQAQTPHIVSATKVGTSGLVRVTFDTPVSPAGETVLLSDELTNMVDISSLWISNSTPYVAGATLDAANTAAYINGDGYLQIDIANYDFWAGLSFQTPSSYSASASQPTVFQITRDFMDSNPDANYFQSGIWVDDGSVSGGVRGFWSFWGEDWFGFDYQRVIGDAYDNPDPPSDNNQWFYETPLVDQYHDMGSHVFKAVVDGTSVRYYVDDNFASEVNFPLSNGIYFEFGNYGSSDVGGVESQVYSAWHSASVSRMNAVSLANWTINNGATVTGVSITSDPKVLELTTTGVANNSPYTLTISGAEGADGSPIAANSTVAIETAATKNAAYAAEVVADSPVGYYQMDQINGDSVPNLGSAGGAGTFTQYGGVDRSEYGPGVGLPGWPGADADNIGGLFDGTKTYIDTGKPYFASLPSGFTIECWVKPSDFINNGAGLVGQNYSTIQLNFSDPGTVQCYTTFGGTIEKPYPFPLNEWHQIVVVGDGTQLLMYFDGALAGTDGVPTADYGDGGGENVCIGGNITDDISYQDDVWAGGIDEVSIYDHVLSAGRIQAHYAVFYDAAARPTISITSPVNGASISPGADVTVVANTAPGSGRTLDHVEFFDNNISVGVVTSPPWQWDIPSILEGRHSFTAIATDDLGVSTLSAAVKVKIGNLPTALLMTVAPLSDLNGNDQAVVDELRRLGFDVALITDDDVAAHPELVTEMNPALVVASDTDNDDAADALSALPFPIVTWEERQNGFWFVHAPGDELDWNDEGNPDMSCVNSTHPIAVSAGLVAGINTVMNTAVDDNWFPWGVTTTDGGAVGGTVIATTADNLQVIYDPNIAAPYPSQIYCFTNGATMADANGPAPERRAFIPIANRWGTDNGFALLTDLGVGVFDAEIQWVALPTFGDLSVSGGNFNVHWVGGLGGQLQSAPSLAGPWTDVMDITDASGPLTYSFPMTGNPTQFFRIKR